MKSLAADSHSTQERQGTERGVVHNSYSDEGEDERDLVNGVSDERDLKVAEEKVRNLVF